jgi:hypothetical protein
LSDGRALVVRSFELHTRAVLVRENEALLTNRARKG